MKKLDASNDPRLIPFGAALRASGLDELPQLINVLRGEMSIVGPRPCIPYEYENYEPWQRKRFDAVPGLTGLWQVSGKNSTTFNQMIHLDIEYSERSSLALDLKIILKTLPAILEQCSEMRSRRQQRLATTTANITKPMHTHQL
jgi:lipopolysaccharide/colanic/teichoic acid biosynthesis glycosyltransferase